MRHVDKRPDDEHREPLRAPILFGVLLRLYPRRHREFLGAEMQAVFEQRAAEQRLQRPAVYLRFLLVEFAGLVSHAAAAHFANLTRGDYLESQALARTVPATRPDLPEEVLEAQNRVAAKLNQLLFAISHHQFVQARVYSNEERKAREALRQARQKYGIGDTI